MPKPGGSLKDSAAPAAMPCRSGVACFMSRKTTIARADHPNKTTAKPRRNENDALFGQAMNDKAAKAKDEAVKAPAYETAGRQSPRRPTTAGLRSTRLGVEAEVLRRIFSRGAASLRRTRARDLLRKAPRQPPATGAPEPPSRAREALPVSSPKDDGEDFAAAESRGIPPPK